MGRHVFLILVALLTSTRVHVRGSTAAPSRIPTMISSRNLSSSVLIYQRANFRDDWTTAALIITTINGTHTMYSAAPSVGNNPLNDVFKVDRIGGNKSRYYVSALFLGETPLDLNIIHDLNCIVRLFIS